jgi:hypothetical protein
MARPTPRVFSNQPRRGRANQFGPYFFQRDAFDVFEEAFDQLLQRGTTSGLPVNAAVLDERAVLREQRWTLFSYDAAMRRLFNDDFDAFCAAMDDPKRMHQRLEERLRSLLTNQRAERAPEEVSQLPGWDDHAAPSRRWEAGKRTPQSSEDESCPDCGKVHGSEQDGERRPTLNDDPIYSAAFQWACRTDRWSRRVYFDQRVRDRDLFRVLANATLVPAKVAFAFPGKVDDDLVGLEVAAIGYRQAAIFLSRVLESLANCHGKRIGHPNSVHRLSDEGRELLADIESRLAEIEAEIQDRGKSH